LVKYGFALVITILPNAKFADEFVRQQKRLEKITWGYGKNKIKPIDKSVNIVKTVLVDFFFPCLAKMPKIL
jgi:hypothetical protein